MEASQWDTPKNTVSLYLRKEAVEITLSSNFDSGNMAKAELGLNNTIVITPAQDCAQFDNPSHSKGWFYFTVSGPPYGVKLKFVIKKMSPLATQVLFRPLSSNLETISVPSSVPQVRNGNGSSMPSFS